MQIMWGTISQLPDAERLGIQIWYLKAKYLSKDLNCHAFICRKDLSLQQREYKKKKAQKKAQRLKQQEDEREQDKDRWVQFNSKVCITMT